jgi:hypothetical protein
VANDVDMWKYRPEVLPIIYLNGKLDKVIQLMKQWQFAQQHDLYATVYKECKKLWPVLSDAERLTLTEGWLSVSYYLGHTKPTDVLDEITWVIQHTSSKPLLATYANRCKAHPLVMTMLTPTQLTVNRSDSDTDTNTDTNTDTTTDTNKLCITAKDGITRLYNVHVNGTCAVTLKENATTPNPAIFALICGTTRCVQLNDGSYLGIASMRVSEHMCLHMWIRWDADLSTCKYSIPFKLSSLDAELVYNMVILPKRVPLVIQELKESTTLEGKAMQEQATTHEGKEPKQEATPELKEPEQADQEPEQEATQELKEAIEPEKEAMVQVIYKKATTFTANAEPKEQITAEYSLTFIMDLLTI